jgi:hypothetical protein
LTHFSLRIAGVGDTRLKPIYAGNRYDARIQQITMKFTREQAAQVLEAVCWCILLYILVAPIVLPQLARALTEAGLP